jgi:hypothetical protein
VFDVLFVYPKVLARHQAGPAAVDRERYLAHCAGQGAAHGTFIRAWLGSPSIGTTGRLQTGGRHHMVRAGTCRWRPPMCMPRSTSRQKPEPWRSARPPTPPARPVYTGGISPRRWTSYARCSHLLCGVEKAAPGLSGHLGAERHISTGATLRSGFLRPDSLLWSKCVRWRSSG